MSLNILSNSGQSVNDYVAKLSNILNKQNVCGNFFVLKMQTPITERVRRKMGKRVEIPHYCGIFPHSGRRFPPQAKEGILFL